MPRFRSFSILNIDEGLCDLSSDKLGSDFYTRLQAFYGKNCTISCSTPAIPLSGHTYLSAGHIRFNIDTLPPGTPLHSYAMSFPDMDRPPYYCYLMFFYTFNPFCTGYIEFMKRCSPVMNN